MPKPHIHSAICTCTRCHPRHPSGAIRPANIFLAILVWIAFVAVSHCVCAALSSLSYWS